MVAEPSGFRSGREFAGCAHTAIGHAAAMPAITLMKSRRRIASGVLDRHLAALNSGDAFALAQALHFPHYRLAGGRMKIWTTRVSYSSEIVIREPRTQSWSALILEMVFPSATALTRAVSGT
jgi:hypothetical protein